MLLLLLLRSSSCPRTLSSAVSEMCDVMMCLFCLSVSVCAYLCVPPNSSYLLTSRMLSSCLHSLHLLLLFLTAAHDLVVSTASSIATITDKGAVVLVTDAAATCDNFGITEWDSCQKYCRDNEGTDKFDYSAQNQETFCKCEGGGFSCSSSGSSSSAAMSMLLCGATFIFSFLVYVNM